MRDMPEKHAYETVVYGGCTYEKHAYEMAPVRGTPMKDARLREIRLWDGLCEKHAYERHAYVFS
jgi:hypothetical protein